MAKKSISLDDETVELIDRIRDAMKEQDPMGRKPPFSTCMQDAAKDWIDKNAHYLDEGDDTGNPFLTLVSPMA